jgi:hypothetical protein
LLWGFPASLVAQNTLWAGWMTCLAITGAANTEDKIAAAPTNPNFIMPSSFWIGASIHEITSGGC